MIDVHNNLAEKTGLSTGASRVCLGLSIVAILTASFHFWPFDESKVWQMLNIANLCCLAGVAILVISVIHCKVKQQRTTWLPHISVWAYILINVLSLTCADTLGRPLNYTLKLSMVLLGGYSLFRLAGTTYNGIRLMFRTLIVSVLLIIGSCLYFRLAVDDNHFGFYRNVFKYGTAVGVLVPLCSLYLLRGPGPSKLLGFIIAPLACFSAGSLGGMLSIMAGLITGLFLVKDQSTKALIGTSFLLSVLGLFMAGYAFDSSVLDDFKLREEDQINLRHRYIEWQAEANMLEKRGVIGTGAGSINDYRSHFYYRLPKLNTLKAFDQNGLLAVSAEIGLFGFLMLVWVFTAYSQRLMETLQIARHNPKDLGTSFVVPIFASWISLGVANLFSSIHYNGLLLWFALLLAFISATHSLLIKDES